LRRTQHFLLSVRDLNLQQYDAEEKHNGFNISTMKNLYMVFTDRVLKRCIKKERNKEREKQKSVPFRI
jgi:hypothetical protein